MEPPNLQPNETPQLAVEIHSGSQRQINIVVKEPSVDDCYLFNNDSYNLPAQCRIQNPAWKMGPGTYRAVVDLSGHDLRTKSFECHFTNPGKSRSLEVLSFKEL